MDILKDTPERVRQLAREIFGEPVEAQWGVMKRIHQQNPGASKEEAIEALAAETFGWTY